MQANQKLLPDAKLNVRRLRTMDAKVRFRANSVRAQRIPVRTASVNVTLKDAVLHLDDLKFGFPQGQLAGKVTINATKDVPVVNLDMRMTGARVEQFIPASAGPALTGGLIGRARLQGSGLSVHEVASNADGTVTLIAPRGEIRKAFAELLGINVVKGLGLLLSENQDKTQVRCAIADFQARDGILHANRLLIDTGPVLSQGSGRIDLRTERIDLRLKGESKEFRLVRLLAPVTVSGTLSSPKIGVDAGKAAGQLGIAAVVGSILAPLAAILPFVDPGLADDADCAGLIAAAGKPAPAAKVAAAPPAKTRTPY